MYLISVTCSMIHTNAGVREATFSCCCSCCCCSCCSCCCRCCCKWAYLQELLRNSDPPLVIHPPSPLHLQHPLHPPPPFTQVGPPIWNIMLSDCEAYAPHSVCAYVVMQERGACTDAQWGSSFAIGQREIECRNHELRQRGRGDKGWVRRRE